VKGNGNNELVVLELLISKVIIAVFNRCHLSKDLVSLNGFFLLRFYAVS